MTFSESVTACLRKYAEFRGRAPRAEYWWFYLFQVLVGVSLAVMAVVIGLSEDAANGLSGVFGLALALPTLAVTARRLHDVDRSGWWMFIPMTIIGIVPFLYWICKEGDSRANEYGAPAT
jgi:uncharacterized membrane protein YhaH (DUF805 family)